MQRFCHLIYQSNWCQNASKLIYQKGEISLMWDAENVVYHRFDFDVCRWNQVDVKVDPCQACFFQNTRCSIFPHDPFCPDLLYHLLIPTHVWLITPCLQWHGILMVHDTWLYVILTPQPSPSICMLCLLSNERTIMKLTAGITIFFHELPTLQFSIKLSGHQLCLDRSVMEGYLELMECHLSLDQRWIYDIKTRQVISMKSPPQCWDIGGRFGVGNDS